MFEDELHPEIRPQDDFNRYVNKIWFEDNPIPDDESRWGTHMILSKNARNNIRGILESETDDPELRKAIIFYKSGLDTKTIEKLGFAPLLPYLDQIDQVDSAEEIPKLLGNFQQHLGISLIGIYASEDPNDSSILVPQLYSAGLGLGDKDYYLKEEKKDMLDKYQQMIVNAVKLFDEHKENAEYYAEQIIKLETELAKVHYSNVEKRDPHLRNNKYQFDALQEEIQLDWEGFFSAVGYPDIKDLIVDNPKFFSKVAELFQEVDEDDAFGLDVWKVMFKVKLLLSSYQFLHDEAYNVVFDFYGKVLQGMKERKPRWEEVVNLVNSQLGELVGKLYVKDYFPPSHKEKMMEMVYHLLDVIEDRIQKLSWMSEETKERAMLKKKAFRAKIGYPDKWTDFSSLEVNEEKSFLENAIAAARFSHQETLDKFYSSSEEYAHEWFMNPHSVNAYFHPLKNEIVFPAGYLQFPMFQYPDEVEEIDPRIIDAINFGAIGGTIGHEITHSFDDKGSQYDHEGNLKNWWTDTDKEKFEQTTQYFVDDYSRYEINGNTINGELTLGENIADHGGMKIAFEALQRHYEEVGRPDNYKGFTPEQLFFMSWGRKWRLQYTDELIDRQMQVGVHSLPEARINVTLANVKEFHEAFGVKEGDGMYRPDLPVLW